MAANDEDALICDLAETYGILTPWRSMPLKLTATLAAGLADTSRSNRALFGDVALNQEKLLAIIADGVHTLIWALGRGDAGNRPPSIYSAMIQDDRPQPADPGGEGEYEAFENTADLLAALYPGTNSAFEEVD